MKLLSAVLIVVLIGCSHGDPYPIDIEFETGEYWIDNFRSNQFPAKVHHDSKIYCSSLASSFKQNYFYCLNLKTGRVDWRAPVESWASDRPIITDSFIYFSSYLGDLYKFDKRGKMLWMKRAEASFGGHCINPFNNNLFVRTVADGLYEHDADNGKIVNHYGDDMLGISLPVFIGNKMYIAGLSSVPDKMIGDQLICTDIKTGKKYWEKKIGTNVESLFINQDRLYYVSTGGIIHCLNPCNGNEYWQSDSLHHISGQYQAIFPHMVFEDNRIFYYESDLDNIIELQSPDIAHKKTYEQLLTEGKMLPVKYLYEIEKGGNKYQVTVSDSMESPNNFRKDININITKKGRVNSQ